MSNNLIQYSNPMHILAPVQRSSNDSNYSPADIANIEVQFPTNTPQMMSKESPAQQLMVLYFLHYFNYYGI